jgi:hypothetical protein
MKNVIIIAIVFMGLLTEKALAQEMGDKEKMKVFTSWTGRWQGEGSMQMGPGEPKKSSIDERIEFKLDGMILQVEGIGKTIDPATKQESVVHHAFAILSFDKGTSQYKFRTYLKDGRSTQAWFNVVSDNNYQWGFDTPQGKIRYTIVMNPPAKTWSEIGEFSADGTTWRKFFDMNLKKTE